MLHCVRSDAARTIGWADLRGGLRLQIHGDHLNVRKVPVTLPGYPMRKRSVIVCRDDRRWNVFPNTARRTTGRDESRTV